MNKKKIFIACDHTKISKVKEIIKSTDTKKLKVGYKFGLEFFYTINGRKFISKLRGKEIFLDLKLNDIPNTCAAAIRSLKDIKNISYLTVHINGGIEMLKEIRKEANKVNKKLKILGVSMLTSFTNTSARKIGFSKPIKDIVKQQAKLARSVNLDGVVCSGYEAKLLKKVCKGMEIFTPGIRLKGDSAGDQKRVMTPKQAFRNGATAIVLGRSITKGNIKNNIQKLIKSL
jgi:orotidine-5'-phosphate decarboxylase